MKKFKSLLLGVVMMAGLTAISATAAHAACAKFSIDCGNGKTAKGEVCGESTEEMVDTVWDLAEAIC